MTDPIDDGGKHRGPAHASPYGLSRLAPSITLVDVAKEIEAADSMIGAVTASKLSLIAEQIRALQARAREILEDASRDLDLHRARCAFPRLAGKTYHLYARGEADLYWSMVSPDEWGGEPPHPYRGSFRLEADQSWTRVDEGEGQARTEIDARALVAQLVSGE
ncbi:MAG: DUF2452 domain-containing protein [Myxococcales bacterium]|nr:DUF2452 domain-containing protein [Myxococcales bacterium]